MKYSSATKEYICEDRRSFRNGHASTLTVLPGGDVLAEVKIIMSLLDST
ncbi:hypothetical protein Back11_44100 [Paenibacillus baekrokdamisoli]|uniref:Uncharacterized protein n=1 Tax=Paenibacillus baekrokdamisoli TaxID=1712516 RepID=A0A3G9J3Z0_9BACL|nr:hypothetical protein [Paenibacillus baekrokdamisoli]MBB3067888.1 hypothetical protein [Paenibacillus baekrokdamisoli]BBH23065.1 hypothetical protein Back11_44100 [Paenibacillus baekrokdamisoli]